MTLGGWVLLILSWGAIIGLGVFCLVMMVRSGKL